MCVCESPIGISEQNIVITCTDIRLEVQVRLAYEPRQLQTSISKSFGTSTSTDARVVVDHSRSLFLALLVLFF